MVDVWVVLFQRGVALRHLLRDARDRTASSLLDQCVRRTIHLLGCVNGVGDTVFARLSIAISIYLVDAFSGSAAVCAEKQRDPMLTLVHVYRHGGIGAHFSDSRN